MIINGPDSVNKPLKRGIVDGLAIFLSVIGSTALILSISGDSLGFPAILRLAAGIGILHVGFFCLLQGYRSTWRFFSAYDALNCVAAACVSTVIAMVAGRVSLPPAAWLVVVTGSVLAATMLRCSVRLVYNYGFFRTGMTLRNPLGQARPASHPRQALMIGYGENLDRFLQAQRRRDGDIEIAGIAGIGSQRRPASLRGVPVLGSIDQIDSIVGGLLLRRRAPDLLILTRDEMEGRTVGDILSLIGNVGAEIAWLPRADQLDTNDGIRLHTIELEDLLPRPAQSFDAHSCEALLSDARVLLTGAGGSIGSELVRQIAALSPAEIVLADSSEHALYEIDREMGAAFPHVKRVQKILDVRDRDAVFRLMKRHRPEFIFHAAALKHVPIVEVQPCEGVLTNVVGSRNVADAAVETQARAMVMVSTDKAVNPASVMGATKRMAEAYCQAMDADMRARGGRTRFVTVRFGNVLGSNGSVVPLFQQQIAEGGPVTVTHPEVERFFMTISEASRLILEAMLAGMEDEGTGQGIFVLDMGKPVRIVDLARQVIRLSGLRPDTDVKIVYTGLRAGEKLFEELMHETENLVSTDHPSLMVARPRFMHLKTVQNQITVISAAARQGDAGEVVRLLKVYIAEFDKTSNAAREMRESLDPAALLREKAS